MQPPLLKKLTLSFTGGWKPMEEQFRRDYYLDALPRIRVSLGILTALYALFSVLDHQVYPEGAAAFMVIRFAIILPGVALFYWVSTASWFEGVYQPVTAFMMVLGAAGILAMIIMGNELVRTSYYPGLLLVTFCLCVFLRVRFVWAASAWLAILLGFVLLNHWLSGLDREVSTLNTFFFISTGVVGLWACREMEVSKRHHFAVLWSLSVEKTMVAAANRSLETRVAERTNELLHANQALREEMTQLESLNRRKIALEARLSHSERMETLGRLAGGVAHDFNNLLTAVIGNASRALEEPPGSSEIATCLKDIVKAGEKAAALTRQLLAFSRKQITEPGPVDLNNALKGLERMILGIIDTGVELLWELDERTGFVMVDPVQLEQVVLNLIVNAAEATKQFGRITIGTRALPEEILSSEKEESANRVHFHELFVSDTGCGMDQETIDKVFEPFFTTRRFGEGAGLGLSTVFGIAKQHGGSVLVESSPGKGSTFRVRLPAAAETAEGSEPGDSAAGSSGSETILVVEDDEMVREIAVKTLAGLGYRVLSAEGGNEALKLAREYKGEIHLLLADVVMPIVNGCTLAEKLKDFRPDMKVIFTSGYPEGVFARHGVQEKEIHFIAKPYTPVELSARIREVLEEK